MHEINEEKYGQFISLLELNNINMESVRCEKNKEFKHTNASLDIALDYEVNETQQLDLEVLVPFKFKVKAFVNETNMEQNINTIDPEDTLFSIEIELLLKYYLDIDEVDTKEIVEGYSDVLEAFAERNVAINAWPYVRETIHSLTAKMGLPPLLIPLKKTPVL